MVPSADEMWADNPLGNFLTDMNDELVALGTEITETSVVSTDLQRVLELTARIKAIGDFSSSPLENREKFADENERLKRRVLLVMSSVWARLGHLCIAALKRDNQLNQTQRREDEIGPMDVRFLDATAEYAVQQAINYKAVDVRELLQGLLEARS